MLNEVKLKGVLSNIQPSHTVRGIEYYRGEITTKRQDGKGDVVNLKFKRFSCPYKDDDVVSLIGNVRSYIHKENGENRTELYVYTYFDPAETAGNINGEEKNNVIRIRGVIYKKKPLWSGATGKHNISFMLYNDLTDADGRKSIRSFIPCVAHGEMAKLIDEVPIGSLVDIAGEIHSRTYEKKKGDDVEIRVVHEVEVLEISTINKVEG